MAWDAIALLETSAPQADRDPLGSNKFCARFGAEERLNLAGFQRLATALTITTVVNNPQAIATVVK